MNLSKIEIDGDSDNNLTESEIQESLTEKDESSQDTDYDTQELVKRMLNIETDEEDNVNTDNEGNVDESNDINTDDNELVKKDNGLTKVHNLQKRKQAE